MRRKAESGAADTQVLEPITPIQQRFIEALLTGQSISAAARLVGIAKRTAMYWLADREGVVRIEYEKQRAQALATLAQRISGLYESALKALEDSLAPEAPLPIRNQTARWLADAHLHEALTFKAPGEAVEMLHGEASEYYEQLQLEGRAGVLLWDAQGKPRIND